MRINEEQTNKTYLDRNFIVGLVEGKGCKHVYNNTSKHKMRIALTEHKQMPLTKIQN